MELLIDMPKDLASAIRAQVDTWMAELKLLRHEPSVEKFLDLQARIDRADISGSEAVAYRFNEPTTRRTGEKRSKLGLPLNELSDLKSEDLDDLVVVRLAGPSPR